MGLGIRRNKGPERAMVFQSSEADDRKPFYVVRKVMTKNGNTGYRINTAKYVKRRNGGYGYVIKVNGKTVPVSGKNAFEDREDAEAYADAKRKCKYGIDKITGKCLTKSGRSAKDYVKKASGGKYGMNPQLRTAALEINRGKRGRSYVNNKSDSVSLMANRRRLSYTEGTKKPRKKRAPSAYNKYMKANLGNMKGMTMAERRARFKVIAKNWKMLSEQQKNKYK